MIDAKVLARRWGTLVEKAAKTMNVITQRDIRTTMDPTLSRRFRTNNRQLRYRRLYLDIFTDTM